MQNLFLKCFGVLLFVTAVAFSGKVQAEISRTPVRLQWQTEINKSAGKQQFNSFISFNGAAFNKLHHPVYHTILPLNGDQQVKVIIENARYVRIENDFQNKNDIKQLQPEVISQVVYERKLPKLNISFIPVRFNNGVYERLESFDLVISYERGAKSTGGFSKKAYTATSVLASGTWLRLNVTKTGIHKIDRAFLVSAGVDPDNIDPSTIKIYSNGPGLLPSLNSIDRIDDLKENAIVVQGESDHKFDETDAVLFFGKSQNDVWKYNTARGRYDHENNYYTAVTAYFLTFGGNAGKRVIMSSALTENHTSQRYDFLYAYEKDTRNLIRTGKTWLGEEFNRELNYNFPVNIPDLDASRPVYIRSSVAARSFMNSSFSVRMNGGNVLTHSNIQSVGPSFEDTYAFGSNDTATFSGTGSMVISYTYNQPIPGALGWLDFFEIQSRNVLRLSSSQLYFRDKESAGAGRVTKFRIASAVTANAWDVTDPTTPTAFPVQFTGSELAFTSVTDTIRSFIVFNGNDITTPVFGGMVANQNIHGLPAGDMFIVTHPDFLGESNRLADFHRRSNLKVHVITVQQIYNEFSGGVQDICAIRDMMRMFYKRAVTPSEMPKYLLLFGRASYDYKNRIENNSNFIPTFESLRSFDPVDSYCSDDYFGLLDDNEGGWDNSDLNDPNELLDIGIGRFPATDGNNASYMVNKTILYASSPDRGDWRLRTVFVADDEDFNIHQIQADKLANNVRSNFKNYNVQKIFIDAFKEVNTSGGARNPDAQAEIVRAVERGCFIVNYTGHGGEVGLAAERILNTNDIQNWTNGIRLPLFVTATCEFSRYDDPGRFAAGEMALINPNGGAIGLFTTVRLVNSGDNENLNTSFYKFAGLDSASMYNRLTLGEIMRMTKNDYLNRNTRNFTLLADPALMLAYPSFGATTTAINNQPVNIILDTLKAYSKVTISGMITNINGTPATGFNGIVYPTVFDKNATYKTLVNNPESAPYTFQMQNKVIFRGKASVKNGAFTFNFIVPKDIAYEVGTGRISYYAENGSSDAAGYDEKIPVGGTADSIGNDDKGPEIRLYMNDEKFVYGGITNEDPLLIAKFSDLSGINITGQGIGRDISMNLNSSNKTTSLNDYFQTKIDSYQDGEVRFKMKDVPAGRNTLKLTAWDVYNNYGESQLEFVVASSEEMALQHVLNYPNPFTTNTTFHFDHNKPGEDLKIMVQIFTISGKLIKTLQTETSTTGNHFDKLSWDGRDDFGDPIGKGVYVYKVKVKSNQGRAAEEFQKLVILN